MLEMYKGVVNSPETTITNSVTNTDTTIYILDETRVPEELPNLMVLGTGIGAETIKVLSRVGRTLTVERGFQGMARAWDAGTLIARNFTEYDYSVMIENIQSLSTTTNENATEITLKANKIQDDFLVVTNVRNGWVHVSPSFMRYYKDEFGVVRLQGSIRDGVVTDGTIVLYLPDGYKPMYAVKGLALRDNDLSVLSYNLAVNGSLRIYGLEETGILSFNITYKAEEG